MYYSPPAVCFHFRAQVESELIYNVRHMRRIGRVKAVCACSFLPHSGTIARHCGGMELRERWSEQLRLTELYMQFTGK